MSQTTNAVIAELMDRRLLNDVDDDLHQEIAEAVIQAARLSRPDSAEARLNDKRNIIQNAIIRCPSFSDLHKAPNLCAYDIADDIIAALSPPSVCGGEAIHAIETLKRTIIKPGPSEPSPPADRREIVARIIDPEAYEQINDARWERLARLESQAEAQLRAERKADAILAALDGGRDA